MNTKVWFFAHMLHMVHTMLQGYTCMIFKELDRASLSSSLRHLLVQALSSANCTVLKISKIKKSLEEHFHDINTPHSMAFFEHQGRCFHQFEKNIYKTKYTV